MLKKLLRILLVLFVCAAIAFTIFWYARPADIAFEDVRGTVPHAEYSHFAKVDGVRIHYQEKGDGPALVLLHGWALSTYTWKDVFDPLAEHFHLIAMDLKGFGFSDKPEGDYTRHAQADLVIHLMDFLHIDHAVLCGNSMGGNVALNAARHYPQRVTSLILVGSSGVGAGGTSSAPRWVDWAAIGPPVAAVALTSDAIIRLGMKVAFYDQSKVSADRIAAYYRPLRTRHGQRAAYLARAQGALHPIAPELHRIVQPTLIIWGKDDQLNPVEGGHRFNSVIQHSQLVILDHCGHMPQEERPELFVHEVVCFIAGNDGDNPCGR
jgi:pimeloyl-ACP methyl ester carboxylesterase